jgi:hypothetical protein
LSGSVTRHLLKRELESTARRRFSGWPGSRSINKGNGQKLGLSLYAPVIVKYRDEKTDLSTTLEELLR